MIQVVIILIFLVVLAYYKAPILAIGLIAIGFLVGNASMASVSGIFDGAGNHTGYKLAHAGVQLYIMPIGVTFGWIITRTMGWAVTEGGDHRNELYWILKILGLPFLAAFLGYHGFLHMKTQWAEQGVYQIHHTIDWQYTLTAGWLSSIFYGFAGGFFPIGGNVRGNRDDDGDGDEDGDGNE